VLASHNLDICRKWCTKAVWMERGRIRAAGEINAVLQEMQFDLARQSS